LAASSEAARIFVKKRKQRKKKGQAYEMQKPIRNSMGSVQLRGELEPDRKGGFGTSLGGNHRGKGKEGGRSENTGDRESYGQVE